MVDKITIEDEFGVHEFETSSDCVTIVDDGNGNISIVEDDWEEDTWGEECNFECIDCRECYALGYSYCVRDEGDDY